MHCGFLIIVVIAVSKTVTCEPIRHCSEKEEKLLALLNNGLSDISSGDPKKRIMTFTNGYPMFKDATKPCLSFYAFVKLFFSHPDIKVAGLHKDCYSPEHNPKSKCVRICGPEDKRRSRREVMSKRTTEEGPSSGSLCRPRSKRQSPLDNMPTATYAPGNSSAAQKANAAANAAWEKWSRQWWG